MEIIHPKNRHEPREWGDGKRSVRPLHSREHESIMPTLTWLKRYSESQNIFISVFEGIRLLEIFPGFLKVVSDDIDTKQTNP